MHIYIPTSDMITLTAILGTMCACVEATRLFGFNFGSWKNQSNTVLDFNVYWNVPTFMCHQYGMHFEEVSKDYGILQNIKDDFRGDQLAILYDPGIFPALLKDSNGKLVRRNGGVPQEGNLTLHLTLFREHLLEQIPRQDFAGLGILDFESWRPIFRQNWASLAPYRDLSTEIERARHPFWDKKAIEREAVRRFEKSARIFMAETLKAAKVLRPSARWAYYAYPYCFNLTPQQNSIRCSPAVIEENDKMSWLFDTQDMLLPSVYLRLNLNSRDRIGLINGRVKEALRISKWMKSRAPVFPYFWYKYQDDRDVYLNREDVENSMKEIAKLGANGIVVWGSSQDVNSRAKCQKFRDYVKDVLGPVARSVIRPKMENMQETTVIGETSTIEVTTPIKETSETKETSGPEETSEIEKTPTITETLPIKATSLVSETITASKSAQENSHENLPMNSRLTEYNNNLTSDQLQNHLRNKYEPDDVDRNSISEKNQYGNKSETEIVIQSKIENAIEKIILQNADPDNDGSEREDAVTKP